MQAATKDDEHPATSKTPLHRDPGLSGEPEPPRSDAEDLEERKGQPVTRSSGHREIVDLLQILLQTITRSGPTRLFQLVQHLLGQYSRITNGLTIKKLQPTPSYDRTVVFVLRTDDSSIKAYLDLQGGTLRNDQAIITQADVRQWIITTLRSDSYPLESKILPISFAFPRLDEALSLTLEALGLSENYHALRVLPSARITAF